MLCNAMFLMGKIMSPRDFEMHQGKTFKFFTNKMNSRAQDTLFLPSLSYQANDTKASMNHVSS